VRQTERRNDANSIAVGAGTATVRRAEMHAADGSRRA
jgi:hypothetical protein